MKSRNAFIAAVLLVAAQGAFAQHAIDPNGVLDMVKNAIEPAIAKLTSKAITWLGIFAVLQFFITNYKSLLGDGDISSALGKLVGSVAWTGICLYLINNAPQFIQDVGDQMMGLLGTNLPSPSNVVAKTVQVAAVLGATAVGVGAIPLIGGTAGQLLVFVTLGILGIGLLFAFKIFMLQLEIMLVSLLAPLSFAFLGLNSLKDQGIAPFKALISFSYRVILLTVILSGFNQVSDILSNVIAGTDKEQLITQGVQSTIQTVLAALAAYLLLAYMAFKSDSIAATLASGSTSMGTGDVASAAATGAALGAAVAVGGATVAGTTAKVPRSMSEFLGKMGGGNGNISNASAMGSGGGGEPPNFVSPTAAMSTSPSVQQSLVSPAVSRQRTEAPTAGSGRAGVGSGRYGESSSDSASTAEHTSVPPSGDTSVQGAATTGSGTGSGATTNGDLAISPSTVSSGSSASAAPAVGGTTGATQSGNAARPGWAAASSREPAAGAAEALPNMRAATPTHSAATSPGSGLTAGIANPTTSNLEQNLSRLVDQLSSQGTRKPTLGEKLGEANRHVSQEHASTHVSINSHHAD